MAVPETAAHFLERQRERLRRLGARPRIVFAEGDDARAQAAAAELARQGICEAVLVGREAGTAGAVGLVNPSEAPRLENYVRLLWERRRARGLSEEEARQQATHPLEFAALMVAAGEADALVAGIAHTTQQIVQTTREIIELAPGARLLTSGHLLAVQNHAYGREGLLVFADAAVILRPSPSELADIAIAAAGFTRTLLETEPRVALLSFSTKGSARHREVDRVLEAWRSLRVRAPDLVADGELQADAALELTAGRSKAPGSPVAGRANTLVFPDGHSASIGYKLVERLGGAAVMAVALLGPARPVNIVWRGCSTEDILHTAVVAAVEAASAREPSG